MYINYRQLNSIIKKDQYLSITINLRNLRQNRQHEDLFKNRFKIGISSDQD